MDAEVYISDIFNNNLFLRLEVIDEDKVVLSSSLDCAVRLWSLNGEFIGKWVLVIYIQYYVYNIKY